MRGVLLRDAQIGDAGDIASLEKISIECAWSEAQIGECLRDPMYYFVVAERGGSLVGYGGIRIIEGEAEILNIAVEKDSRKLGIGTAIIKRLTEKAQGCEIFLEVSEKNTDAAALYGKLGFECYSVRKNYYKDSDALLMKKTPIRVTDKT